MKLNYRDIVILGILLAVVILIAGFFLLIKPKNEEIKTNKSNLATLQTERDQIDGKIAEIEPLKQDITDTVNDTNTLAAPFVTSSDITNARQVDQYMQHFAEDAKVKIMSLTAADISTSTLNYYYFTPHFIAEDQLAQADLNGEQQAYNESAMAESNAISARNQETVLSAQYAVTVEAESKEELWAYMQALEEQEETIIINSVTFTNLEIKETSDNSSKNDDEDEVLPTAQFVITLYSVYDLAQPNLEQ